MRELLSLLFCFVKASLSGRCNLALENLALRQQLAILKRTQKRPAISTKDRLFWVWLSRIWSEWRAPLLIVKPDTLIGWHRKGFRLFWTRLSRRKIGGRPSANSQIIALIKQMTQANPLWGAPRIHGELLKLGIDNSERSVSQLMPEVRKPPSQTWRTFLNNHISFPGLRTLWAGPARSRADDHAVCARLGAHRSPERPLLSGLTPSCLLKT